MLHEIMDPELGVPCLGQGLGVMLCEIGLNCGMILENCGMITGP